jgi:hypothetical protein
MIGKKNAQEVERPAMAGNLQIYCIGSEYQGIRGRNPLSDLLIYSIVVDQSKIGVTAYDSTKIFSVENGPHQVSVNVSRWRSSAPLDVVVRENQTVALVCGIDKKGKIFIEPDVPSSVAVQRSKEESLRASGGAYRASIHALARVIGLLGGTFIVLEIFMYLQYGGVQRLPIVILLCLSVPLLGVGIFWIYRKISGKARQPKK